MRLPAPTGSDTQRQAGFTLVELLISMVLIAEILVAALVIFDFNNRLTRVQTHVADMQQSLRVGMDEITYWTRMAGRGGLVGSQPAAVPPADPDLWHYLPHGVAVEVGPCYDDPLVCGNAPAGSFLDPANDPRSAITPGTDVLIVRGILSTPIYQVNINVPTSFTLDSPDPAQATSGTLTITSTTPLAGSPQSLEPLVAAITSGIPEAILLVSPLSDRNYAVVQLDPGNSQIIGPVADPVEVRLAFVTPGTAGTPRGNPPLDDDYLRLSANQSFSPTLNRVAFAGILEEYRFYLRATDTGIETSAGREVQPRLARARFYPGTDLPYRGDPANWGIDIADNIIDLQVALGVDSPTIDPLTGNLERDGRIAEPPSLTGTATEYANDEWLMNHSLDNQLDARWNAPGARLTVLRVSLLARSARPDPGYQAAAVDRIEDADYGEGPQPTSERERIERLFRRRLLTTEIDLRNVG